LVNKHISGILEEGNSLRGNRDGTRRFAKYTFLSGDYYEGEWENGIFDGVGTHLLVNGQKYEGTWSKGKN
jgi:hypothetical protein